jgi:hypothetical protein
MPESVFTQTMPLLLAGGVCCCAAGLLGVEDAEELDGAGIAVGVGLVVAGGVELVRLDAEAGAGELAGVELGAGVLAAEASAEADFLERDFLGVPASAVPA